MESLYHASAPATLMLLGEHGVLRGGHALVAAVNQRLHVILEPLQTQDIEIESELGHYKTSLGHIHSEPPFTYILTLLKLMEPEFKTGFKLRIQSEFKSTLGFGSSAAVVVATLGVLYAWLDKPYSDVEFIEKACQVVRFVQGKASGADLAASYLGGLVGYKNTPHSLWFKSFKQPLEIVAIYSGKKVPTPEVIEFVDNKVALNPLYYKSVFEMQDEGVKEVLETLEKGRNPFENFELLFEQGQETFEKLHVNTLKLAELVQFLKEQPTIKGAKISGSGLGDCVIGLGKSKSHPTLPTLSLEVDVEGLKIWR
jgi:mevalonate kinase